MVYLLDSVVPAVAVDFFHALGNISTSMTKLTLTIRSRYGFASAVLKRKLNCSSSFRTMNFLNHFSSSFQKGKNWGTNGHANLLLNIASDPGIKMTIIAMSVAMISQVRSDMHLSLNFCIYSLIVNIWSFCERIPRGFLP